MERRLVPLAVRQYGLTSRWLGRDWGETEKPPFRIWQAISGEWHLMPQLLQRTAQDRGQGLLIGDVVLAYANHLRASAQSAPYDFIHHAIVCCVGRIIERDSSGFLVD